MWFRGAEGEADRHRFEEERADPGLVFERYYDEVFRYCRVRCSSDFDAEDVCSQVFLEAIGALDRLRWRGRPVVALLYTIAGRRLADQARRAGRPASLDALPDLSDRSSTDPLAGPELQRALLELPEEQRLAVFLQLVRGSSFAEVAAILGRSEKAAKNLVYRGLETVRRSLLAQGVTP